jgi:hypothetical protein
MQETITKQIVKYGNSAHIILPKMLEGKMAVVMIKSAHKELIEQVKDLSARISHLEDRNAFQNRFVPSIMSVKRNKKGNITSFGKPIPLKTEQKN